MCWIHRAAQAARRARAPRASECCGPPPPRFMSTATRRQLSRGIARTVGVDVSTVAYHGGAKHELIARALALDVAPAELLDRALSVPRDQVPAALVRVVTVAWADESRRRPVELLLSTALTDPRVGAACPQLS